MRLKVTEFTARPTRTVNTELDVLDSVHSRMRRLLLLPFLLPQPLIASDFRFEETVAGTQLLVIVRQPVTEDKAKRLAEWARSSAGNVLQVYGRFPSKRARVILTPSGSRHWGSRSAVSFGQTTRSAGGTVELFINPKRPMPEFYGDWTATHEFSHLMLPLLERRHRWISEGFASYYQNVLMARAGHYTAESAWRRLSQGFQRGRASRPELSPNEAAQAGVSGARMKLYWSGAALALIADLELRRATDYEKSLDTVLGQLQDCCLPSRRVWSGTRLFRRLDSFLDEPVFMPLYRKYADTPGFPEVSAALNSAENAEVRHTVMQSKEIPNQAARRP